MDVKKRILIIDDEEDFVFNLKTSLENEGFEIITAKDGQEGLLKAQEENPDLLLLDIMMPNLNGYQVCRLLKYDDKFKHIPIIMLTARSLDKDKITGDEMGADLFMMKPFENSYLISKIKELLDKQANKQIHQRN